MQKVGTYILSQVLGAIAASAVLYFIATGAPGAEIGSFAANGFGEHSPGKYSAIAAFVTEVVMTFMFLIVILGATHTRASPGFAGIAIGLALTLIHLISIPVTNTSVKPSAQHGPHCSLAAGRSSSSGSSGWLDHGRDRGGRTVQGDDGEGLVAGYNFTSQRRDARVAEGGALLRRYRGLNLYRGFESLSLRHYSCVRTEHIGYGPY